MVCKHPEVQEKICHEAMVATSAGDTASVDEFLQSLTDQALNNMHYLHAALTETLRLYPSVPMVINYDQFHTTIELINQTTFLSSSA
jgi:cytochrome P450